MTFFSKDASIFQAFQAVLLPGEDKASLFIGPRESLQNESGLKQQGITHIISVMDGASALKNSSHFQKLVFDVLDDPSSQLLDKWPACCEFVDIAIAKRGAVLVHCDAGSSRSGATLIACLMYLSRRSAAECLLVAQRARNVISPNDGFWAQLLMWEFKCCGNVFIAAGAHMHEIRPRLWLGAIEATQDWQRLQDTGITHVITCGRGLETTLPAGVDRICSLSIDDLDEVDIMEHLPATSDIIVKTLAASLSNRILVHCAGGKSRSASVVIAYLMREDSMEYCDAFSLVQSIRSSAQPNSGFTHQLAWYGKNGCPMNLCDKITGQKYSDLVDFRKLLRKYTQHDVLAFVKEAGAGDPECRDADALQRALNSLDRLQNAMPTDDRAREAKKAESRRINGALDKL